MASFFLPGKARDLAYINVRDSANLVDAKAFVESLWPIYRPLADSHFLSDARNHFLERFWEMYVACALMEHGIRLHRVGDEGLEFYFLAQGRRVWVEAIAPGPGDGPDRVPGSVPGQAYAVPADKILLRFTSAFREKRKRLDIATKKGLVSKDDQVLLAINSRGIPHAPYGAEIPYILKAFLPFGALTFQLDKQANEIVDAYHAYRPALRKENKAEVGTTTFLEAESASFVAVLHSAVDCANRPALLGDDFLVLHNPSSTQQLSRNLFSWCRQYEYADGELREIWEGRADA